MRTVPGRTDRVVIVGAGLAGLSAALRLAGAGREVTVLEREDVPGGRNGLLELASPGGDGTYRFDTGPTVLTMPDLIADALDCVGERLEDWLELTPVDPLYRAFYPDGSVLDVKADVSLGPDSAGGFKLTGIALTVRGEVSGIDEAQFQAAAKDAKETCPVSKALTGVEITLDATFES